ncbi:hypothetical protein LJY25_09155 [Hymenobacter sp. BT175]|uniref:hypothetical protein n=1 Tax=Hymenobacter translucens TaxID=2886507 RepID=UPI001D0EADC2|nr:hypothetical protein [Hymenobacter translucens]MCC2546609.1 hypothetical protein [Hymenobacter translucens]
MRLILISTALVLAALLPPFTSAAQVPSEAAAAEPGGPIPLEPDSVTRHLFSSNRVRAVLKVRLDAEGEVRDTVAFQEVDARGRFTEVRYRQAPRLHRQWSYDAKGRCTAQVTQPSTTAPYTFIHTYNPALRLGSQQVLRPNGNTTTLCEESVIQQGDSLVIETRIQAMLMGTGISNRKSRQVSIRYAPHPDTILTLHYGYSAQEQLVSATASYGFSREGHLLEVGQLDLQQAARAQKVKTAAGQLAPRFTVRQALHGLRRGRFLYPRQRWVYNHQGRVVEQSIMTRLSRDGQVATTLIKYSYNSLGQLIGREQSTSSVYSPPKAAYYVFSYAPNGLLLGETSDARSEKPMFYRYLYQYYE